jgi:hypothetical protein
VGVLLEFYDDRSSGKYNLYIYRGDGQVGGDLECDEYYFL